MDIEFSTVTPKESLGQRLAAWILFSGLLAVALEPWAAPAPPPPPPRAPGAPNGPNPTGNGLLSPSDLRAAAAIFNQQQTPSTGLGPVFNDDSCGKCHHAPNLGGDSQTTALRAGIFTDGVFSDPPGGSLIDHRALAPQIVPRVPNNANVRAIRASISTLGDGYVEAVPDQTLQAIAAAQPGLSNGQIHGVANLVPVLELPNATAVGRFGWKAQHASLLSFSADAFRNEMGITTPLFPIELSSNGNSVQAFEPAGFFETTSNRPDNNDVISVTSFMRSTPVRARIPGAPDLGIVPRGVVLSGQAQLIKAGEGTFTTIGCGICHVASLTTGVQGTAVNGGAYTVQPPLAGITFHPFSDYLLHDVGTGDGIVQTGGQSTRNQIRTAPLWGISTRKTFMHDGASLDLTSAILRHAGEATGVIQSFQSLPSSDQQNLLTFLNSL